jgi:hypothetical protein
MFNNRDVIQFREKGIIVEKVIKQINLFKKGFPYIKLVKAAKIRDGIKSLNPALINYYIDKYESAGDLIKIKFVPASGAASRMFKALFEFRSAAMNSNFDSNLLKNVAYRQVSMFFENISKFAFYNDLINNLPDNDNNIEQLIKQNKLYLILDALFNSGGLNYGSLPKGLLKFHIYANNNRTAVEEHMVEGALYAKNADGTVKIHFTVSPEHKSFFEELIKIHPMI